MGSDSNVKLATQQSIKAYTTATLTAQDLDFQGDSGGALNIDLDSETMTWAGDAGIDFGGQFVGELYAYHHGCFVVVRYTGCEPEIGPLV